ncbi:hypothetical protein BDV24DRAFT_136910, partial [Aspergillus arachidicola]
MDTITSFGEDRLYTPTILYSAKFSPHVLGFVRVLVYIPHALRHSSPHNVPSPHSTSPSTQRLPYRV